MLPIAATYISSYALPQILAWNGDNATSNDKQNEHLDKLPNVFDKVNRVRCFNHTMQLSAKALLKPFSGAAVDKDDGDKASDDNNDVLLDDVSDEEEGDQHGDDDNNNNNNNNNEDDDDILNKLSDEEREDLLGSMAAVRATLDKASKTLNQPCMY